MCRNRHEINAHLNVAELPHFFADAEVEGLLMDKIMPIMDDNGKRMWACTVCDYTRKLKNDVVKHVERRHLDLQLICSICNSSFKSRNDLKLHVSGHQILR